MNDEGSESGPDYTRARANGGDAPARDEKETGRIDAFSDGVFAIAVTLLVLTIQIPDPKTLVPHTLAGALLSKWPVYVAYIISFCFILIMWINHHNMFRSIGRADHWLLLLNGTLLLFVTLVPFPTALLAEYMTTPDATTAAVVYAGLFTFIAVVFNVLWWYVVHHSDLLLKRMDARLAGSITRRYRWGPVLYFVSLILAFINVFACIGLNVALAIYFALPHPVDAKRTDESSGVH